MKNFILLYNGPATAPDASHQGWPEWFERAGERLVDVGSPMVGGFVLHQDGTTTDPGVGLNGFSIVQAADRADLVDLVRDHPFLAGGPEYTIDVFEVPRK